MARQPSLDAPTRICGIDPGLQCTGYGILEATSDGASIVEAGTLSPTSNDAPLAERLAQLAQELDAVLGEHTVDAVAVEQLYAHYKHPRTAILMGHARGVLMLTAARHGVPVIDLPATTIKRHLTGAGHASKQQMQTMVARTLGLPALPEPPDVADALAIALCALAKYRADHAAANAQGASV
jgi:crossover junction endodeoxyribonuclease RuvC